MADVIKIVEAACGQGKTKWVKEQILSRQNQKFLYVAPAKENLAEVESYFKSNTDNEPKEGGLPFRKPNWFLRVDSDTAEKKVKRTLEKSSTNRYKCVLITHEGLFLAPTSLFEGRTVIIDEAPNMFKYDEMDFTSMKILKDDLGFLETPEDLGETYQFVNVSKKARKWLRDEGKPTKGSVWGKVTDVLKKINTSALYSKDYQILVHSVVDEEIVKKAEEFIVLCADANAGDLKDWMKYFDFKDDYYEVKGLAKTVEHPNTTIIYLDDRTDFGSQRWLTKNLTALTRRYKTINSACDDINVGNLLWTSNKQYLGKKSTVWKSAFKNNLGSRFDTESNAYLGCTARGFNSYTDRTTVLYLAATQPDPKHVGAYQELLNGRPINDILLGRHVHNMYQFVMRTKLRVDNKAKVLVFVPTKGDAVALNKVLNAGKIQSQEEFMANRENLPD